MKRVKCVCRDCSRRFWEHCNEESADLCELAYEPDGYVCDRCKDADVKYVMSDMELCKNCARELLIEIFSGLDLTEMANLLDVDFEDFYDPTVQ